MQMQDQENVYALKGKSGMALPAKRQGLTMRGALGDLNSNVQAQRDIHVGKVAVATAEYEKKASLSRANNKRWYFFSLFFYPLIFFLIFILFIISIL